MRQPQRRVPWTAAVALATLMAGTVRAHRRLHALPVLPVVPGGAGALAQGRDAGGERASLLASDPVERAAEDASLLSGTATNPGDDTGLFRPADVCGPRARGDFGRGLPAVDGADSAKSAPPGRAPHGADGRGEWPPRGPRAAGPATGWRLIAARGVHVDERVRQAAVAHAERERLRVLDLVPGHLGTEQALGLLRLVDPATYRDDRLAAGRGAGCAVLVADDVCRRAGLAPDVRPEAVELLRLVRRLKEYAPDTTGLAIAPGLTAPAPHPAARREHLHAQGLPAHLIAAAQLAGLALLGRSVAARSRWGAAAAALYCLQPYLVLGPGSPLRPADLARTAIGRPLHCLGSAVRTLVANPPPDPEAADRAALRRHYAAELAADTGRFFEKRRPDCPWCGSADLAVRVRVPDLLQAKPGRFTLEQCGTCGHVFQNPRLTRDGLDFYYRDFYDGLGGSGTGRIFGSFGGSYRDRAEMIRPFAAPAAWLDVGTGHGHFCNAARAVWPGTRFDGLDMSQGVRDAERRGWIDTGYQGQFPELAASLAGRYDVVSMHHYLEHTRDPFAELDAAATVLAPGGHLLIELPDPESRLARLLGPYWLPWFQPQHQHLIPVANLRQALIERGFTVVAEQFGAAHQSNDFVGAVALAANRLAPDPDAPWAPGALTRARRAARLATRAVALPCYLAAGVLDALRSAVARGTDGGNAYRLLARKEEW